MWECQNIRLSDRWIFRLLESLTVGLSERRTLWIAEWHNVRLSEFCYVRLSDCQAVLLIDCQNVTMSNYWNYWNYWMSNYWTIRCSDCQTIKLSNCHPVRVSEKCPFSHTVRLFIKIFKNKNFTLIKSTRWNNLRFCTVFKKKFFFWQQSLQIAALQQRYSK